MFYLHLLVSAVRPKSAQGLHDLLHNLKADITDCDAIIPTDVAHNSDIFYSNCRQTTLSFTDISTLTCMLATMANPFLYARHGAKSV
jgi:hypothetical protein